MQRGKFFSSTNTCAFRSRCLYITSRIEFLGHGYKEFFIYWMISLSCCTNIIFKSVYLLICPSIFSRQNFTGSNPLLEVTATLTNLLPATCAIRFTSMYSESSTLRKHSIKPRKYCAAFCDINTFPSSISDIMTAHVNSPTRFLRETFRLGSMARRHISGKYALNPGRKGSSF